MAQWTTQNRKCDRCGHTAGVGEKSVADFGAWGIIQCRPVNGPFRDSASARATVEWCKLRALVIDKKAGDYFYTVETATGGRGIFTPTGNLFTPWFKGLLP